MNDKKRIARVMLALKDQGLVRIEGKTAGLTAEGLKAARKLVGHLQLEDCLPGLDVLLSFIETDHEWIGGEGSPETGYISEASLAGLEAWPKGTLGKPRLPDYWVEDAMTPLSVAGLIDHDFRVDFELPLYFLTEEGGKLAGERLKNGKANPKAWPKLKKRVGQYKTPSVYKNALESAKAALEYAKPLQSNRAKHSVGDIWPATDISAAEKEG